MGQGPWASEDQTLVGFCLALPVALDGGLLLFHPTLGAGEEALVPCGSVREDHLLSASGAGEPGGKRGDETIEDPLGEAQCLADLIYALLRFPVEPVGLLEEGVLIRILAGHGNLLEPDLLT